LRTLFYADNDVKENSMKRVVLTVFFMVILLGCRSASSEEKAQTTVEKNGNAEPTRTALLEPTATNFPIIEAKETQAIVQGADSNNPELPEKAFEITQIQSSGYWEANSDKIAYSLDGTKLAVVGLRDGIFLTSTENLEKFIFIETGSPVESISFSPDGLILASGSRDNSVKLWRASDGMLLQTFAGHTNWVLDVSFSPNGEQLASGSGDYTIRVWQTKDGTLVKILEGCTIDVSDVLFSPDGNILASECGDRVLLWNPEDGTLLHELDPHPSSVYDMVFSPDGQLLATTTNDGKVIIWRISDGVILHTLSGSIDYYTEVIFSPDSQLVAFYTDHEGCVYIWRVTDGMLLYKLPNVFSPAFSPDSQLLATGSMDSAFSLWRVKDGALLQRIPGTPYGIVVGFSPDGQYLVLTNGGGFTLWRIEK
jgi:WD40 repeat protein